MLDILRYEFSEMLKISQMLQRRYEQELIWLLRLAAKSKSIDGGL